MELKLPIFLCQLRYLQSTGKGHFLIVACSTFTLSPGGAGNFTQNMWGPGKFWRAP